MRESIRSNIQARVTVVLVAMGMVTMLFSVCFAKTAGGGTSSGKGYPDDRFIVKFKNQQIDLRDVPSRGKQPGRKKQQGYLKAKSQTIDNLNKKHGAKILRRLLAHGGKKKSNKAQSKNKNDDTGNIFLLEVPAGSNIEQIVSEYKADANVEFAQPDYYMKPAAFPADPPDDHYFSRLWGLDNSGQRAIPTDPDSAGTPDSDIDALEAWANNPDSLGEGIVVGVVDSGIVYEHEDLSGNIWTNVDEAPGDGGDGCPGVCLVDDDGDGLADEDSNGCGLDSEGHFVTFEGIDCTEAYLDDLDADDDENGFNDDLLGWDFGDEDADPQDNDGHGTHVAGIIAAEGNNGLGVIGVAPRAVLMPVKVFSDASGGTASMQADGILYAAENGARVINISAGCKNRCPSNEVVERAVREAYALGAVIVFSSGNDDDDVRNYSPKYMTEVLTVAATDQNDLRKSYSNYGVSVDVSAPGHQIYSTHPRENPFWVQYDWMGGTSSAAPHVSGVAALILSKSPHLTVDQVQSIIRASSDDIEADDFDIYTGFGRLNANKALSIDSPLSAVISSPVQGAIISPEDGNVEIRGIVDGVGFGSYQIFFQSLEGGGPWVEYAGPVEAAVPGPDGLLASIPVRDIPAGDVLIRLSVSDEQGTDVRYEDIVQVFRQYDPTTVTVVDENASPLGFVEVRAISLDGSVYQSQYTDINGRATFLLSPYLEHAFEVTYEYDELTGEQTQSRNFVAPFIPPVDRVIIRPAPTLIKVINSLEQNIRVFLYNSEQERVGLGSMHSNSGESSFSFFLPEAEPFDLQVMIGNSDRLTVGTFNLFDPVILDASMLPPSVTQPPMITLSFSPRQGPYLSGAGLGLYVRVSDPDNDVANVVVEGLPAGMTPRFNIVRPEFTFKSFGGSLPVLEEDRKYEVSVTADDAAGNRSVQNASFTVQRYDPPLEPQNVTAVTQSHDRIKLQWDPVEGAVQYVVFRNGLYVTKVVSETYMDIGLQDSTRYTYTLRAVNSQGYWSGYSAPAFSTTSSMPTPSPSPSPSP